MCRSKFAFSHENILYVYIFLFIFVFIKECLSVCKFAVYACYACYACMQHIYIKFKYIFISARVPTKFLVSGFTEICG